MFRSSMQHRAALFGAASLLALTNSAAAQDGLTDDTEAPEAQAEADSDVIVVDGVRRQGLTLSNVEPELVLTESDIEAYGVSSLGELLAELAPETSSGRSRRGGGGGRHEKSTQKVSSMN